MNNNAALLVILASLAGVILAVDPPNPEYRNYFAEAIKECKDCVGATDEDIANANVRGPLTSPSQECLQYCLYHKVEAQDGVKYNLEKAIEAYKFIHREFPERVSKAEETVNMCAKQGMDQGGSDPCKVASFTQSCFRAVNIPKTT